MQESVPGMVWDEKLATGLAEIDGQHRELFAIANELHNLCEAKAATEDILVDLSYFRSSAVTNFETEEQLMQHLSINQRHQNSHQQAHQDFLRHIDRITRLLVTRVEVEVGVMLDFLLKWLEMHISGADRVMAREVIEIQTGVQVKTEPTENGSHDSSLDESIEDMYAMLGERTIEILELNLQLQEEIARRKQAEKDFSLSQTWIRTVADQAHSWEYWQGPDRELIYMSPSCEQITGYTVAEFTANPDLLYTIIHPEDRHLMDIHQHYIALHSEDEGEVDFRILRRDGETRWIAHTCKAVYGKNGQYMGRRGSRRDRTDRYQEEESLRMAVAVFEVVNEAVVVTNRDNQIIAVNPSFSTITGYQPDEVIGMDPRLLSDDGMKPELINDLWRTLVRTGRWQGELKNRRKNGEAYICWLSTNSVRNDAGHVTSFVSVFSDITERKADEKRIHYLAHYDLTTCLPNRALFNDRLKQSLLAAKRYNANLSLMFIDLDKFKPVNDRFGHDIGDLLLKEVAQRLLVSVRASDTAARIGGDEFVVLLPGTGSDQGALSIATKILQEIERPFLIEGHHISISASIGIAIYPEHGNDVRQILKHADHAMYQAKQGAGPSIVLYGDLGNKFSQLQH